MKRVTITLAVFILGVGSFDLPDAFAQSDSLVTVSPQTPFPRNKQNEPGLAINPVNPNIVVAGANDEIDLEACNAGDDTTCPFTTGIGTSGVYFSFNGGGTWTQPTYTGWSARNASCTGSPGNDPGCQPAVGPIGTLPRYYENGLVSDGDPSLAFGPRRGSNGEFSWANGVRLYYTNLTANFGSVRSEASFAGFEAIAISRTDDVAAAAAGNKDAWKPPVIVSKQNSALFSDHEQVWADNVESSPYFGNVYVCFAAFRGQEKSPYSLPNPIKLARSTDGGDTWTEKQLSPAVDNLLLGRQDCGVRTDSQGIVYVFWQGGDPPTFENTIFLVRSFDGGKTFDRPQRIGTFDNCALFDPVGGDTFDGVTGARAGSFPTLDVANGAPTGIGATDRIVVTWCTGQTPTDANPGPNEKAVVKWSTDHGETFSGPVIASPASDRPLFPAIAISPNGQDVYITYDNFLQPYRTTTTLPRLMQGVVRHADFNTFNTIANWADVHRAPIGDARASSANAPVAEFLGDYNNILATNGFAVATWNDVRLAADCPPIDAFRQSLLSATPLAPPAPNNACAPTFGNSDIWGGPFPDPTP
jgi:hypothetical protein